MISVSSEWKDIMNRPIRNRAFISVGIGIINQNAQASGKANGDFTYWSHGDIFDATSLSSVDGSKLNGLARGVSQLGTAMQNVNSKNINAVSRLSENITKLSTVNISGLEKVASSLPSIASEFNKIGEISVDVQKFTELANGISRLGNKSATNAITNIPKLATSMKQLMKELSTAPKVSQNVIQMTNALASLSAQGSKVGNRLLPHTILLVSDNAPHLEQFLPFPILHKPVWKHQFSPPLPLVNIHLHFEALKYFL